jgi:hypothetical protein
MNNHAFYMKPGALKKQTIDAADNKFRWSLAALNTLSVVLKSSLQASNACHFPAFSDSIWLVPANPHTENIQNTAP